MGWWKGPTGLCGGYQGWEGTHGAEGEVLGVWGEGSRC